MRRTGILLAAAMFALGAMIASGGGCTLGGRIPRSDIQSPDAVRRALAVQSAARDQDIEAVPLIVDRLEDEDDGVRFFAILALERLTGETFGYEYYKPPARQVAAIERWRDYVRSRGGRLPSDVTVAAASAPAGATQARVGASAAGRDAAAEAALQPP